MKKIIYFVAALIYFFFLSILNGSAQPSDKPQNNSYLAFYDSVTLKKINDSPIVYAALREKFKIVSLNKFTQFRNNFNEIFNNTIQITHSFPIPFSIFKKYQEFQDKLKLQDTQFVDETNTSFLNIVRVYPAIDTNKIFYLVLMREIEQLPGATPPAPTTDRAIYYIIKNNAPFGERDVQFSEVPANPTDMGKIEDDIKNFQTKFDSIIQVQSSGLTSLTFRQERSFSYPIAEYDELLGDQPGFWNVANEKNDQNSNVIVRIFPGIDRDVPKDVRFRLMLKLYRYTLFGGYQEIQGKGIFDNIDPCPNVCPDSLTDIKKP